MAIYQYEKVKTRNISADEIVIDETVPYEQYDPNLWKSVGKSYGMLQKLTERSSLANLIIPSFFIVLGLMLIYRHFYPQIQSFLNDANKVTEQGNTAPVSENYIDLSQYISNPAGLTLATDQAFDQDILQEDTKSRGYGGLFYISIPSLSIDRLPVQANVDSTSENAYNTVLKNSLAHFENTGLPFSDVDNNIVIYGHSASSNYNPRPTDPEVAFSFLTNLRVGDEIILEMEGKKYNFKMSKSKIVEPTDLSIVTGQRNKRTLTLFTCYPAGSSGKRFVAVARPA